MFLSFFFILTRADRVHNSFFGVCGVFFFFDVVHLRRSLFNPPSPSTFSSPAQFLWLPLLTNPAGAEEKENPFRTQQAGLSKGVSCAKSFRTSQETELRARKQSQTLVVLGEVGCVGRLGGGGGGGIGGEGREGRGGGGGEGRRKEKRVGGI